MKNREVNSIKEVDLSGMKMPVISVYEHPEDFPEKCVARIFELDRPTNVVIVYLCVEHHRTGKAAVHQNRESDLILKRYAQEIYERDHTREEFRTRYGKSYL